MRIGSSGMSKMLLLECWENESGRHHEQLLWMWSRHLHRVAFPVQRAVQTACEEQDELDQEKGSKTFYTGSHPSLEQG